MIPDIKIEYGNHEITYREEQDFWVCRALALDASSLKALKAKIDKLDADRRRLPSVPVIFVSFHSTIEQGGERGWNATLLTDDGKEVWITKTAGQGTQRERTTREKRSLSTLVLDTPENRKALAESREAYRRGAELQAQGRAMADMVPRVTEAELRAVAAQQQEALNANS